MKRWLICGPLLAVLGLAVLLSALLLWTLRTESGARWLFAVIDARTEAVALEYGDGTLTGPLRFDAISVEIAAGSLDLSNVALDWRPSCLLRRAICVDSLSADSAAWRQSDAAADVPDGAGESGWQLPVALEVSQLRIGELLIRTGAVDEQIQAIELAASVDADRATVDALQFDWRGAHWLSSASLEGGFESIQLRLNVHHPDSRQLGIPELAGRANQLDVGVELDGSIDALQLRAASTGRFSGAVAGQLDLAGDESTVALQIQWIDAAWPVHAGTVGLVNSVLALSGSSSAWMLEGEGDLVVPELPDAGSSLAPEWRLVARGDTESAQLEQIELVAGDSRVAGSGDIDWVQQLTTNLQLVVDAFNPALVDARFPGSLSGQLDLAARRSADASAMEVLRLELSGQLGENDLELEVAGSASSTGIVEIEQLRFTSGENSLQLEGRYDGDWQFDGRVDLLRLDTLPLPGPFSGSLSGSLRAAGAGLPRVELDLAAAELRSPMLIVDSGSVRGVLDPSPGATSDFRITASMLRAANRQWQSARVHLLGRPGDHRLELELDGVPGTSAVIEGAFDSAWDWRGAIEAFDLTLPSGNWRLEDSLAASWQSGGRSVALADHCWRRQSSDGAGRICLGFSGPVGEAGSLAFELSDIPVAPWLPQVPEEALVGALQGAGQIDWAPGTLPALAADLQVTGARIRLDAEAPHALAGRAPIEEVVIEQLDTRILLSPDRWSSEGALRAGSHGNAEWRLAIDPMDASRPLVGDIAVRDFELRILAPLLAGVDGLQGQLQVDGTLAGTLESPLYEGDIQIVNWGARLSELPLPIEFERGTLDVRVRQTQAVLAGSWYLGEDRLELAGSGDWSDLDNPRFNLAMSSDGVNILYPPWLDARVSPRLSLQLSDRQLSLLGTVVVPRADVSIIELPEGAVRLSRDEVIIAPVATGSAPVASPAIRFAADLNVRLGDSVAVSGRGLQADLAGQFRVQYSDATAPMLRGELNVTRGSYQAYGQNLEIRRGRLLFVGPIGETAIDVEAERTIGSQRAGVLLSGRFASPVVELYAVPSQTPENALAYILLGRPLTAENDREDANAVAAAALSLGVRGAQGIAGQIGERFGIEELELEASGSGEQQQVAISGRLSDRLTARYGVGILTPENTLTLRYELTRQLYAEITQSIESALDFYYSMEF